jgi:DNA polymerase II large subunit
LEGEDQILEMKVQDVVLPCSPVSPDEPADEVFFRTASFVDELLEKLYGQKPFYNLKTKHDLVGHLVIGLAPHTSAGITLRIIGFSKTQGFFATPYAHAAMRRDCDGDESCILLLLDAFLNFSKFYLPSSRGSTMDAPLVLTSVLIPAEVDDMVFNVDIANSYPLELYRAADGFRMPYDVYVKRVANVIGSEAQYEGFGFTHDTASINAGVLCSAYKLLPSMAEKVDSQMDVAVKIRAVDESDVARLIIEKHFIRDTKGNLRKFSTQEFRCVNCNEKFRRPPLSGKCTACGGKIIFTISEGSIVKYMDYSILLSKKYHVSPYVKQVIELTQRRIEGLFGKDKEVQKGLKDWFEETPAEG